LELTNINFYSLPDTDVTLDRKILGVNILKLR